MSAESHAHVLPLRTYVAVFLALLVGTAATVWASRHDFGPLNDPIALAIAGTKAALVILFFMHVKYQTRLIWVFATAGFVWLVLFFVLILADYRTRVPVVGW
jgi:cytochrome c oxidase subunit IV